MNIKCITKYLCSINLEILYCSNVFTRREKREHKQENIFIQTRINFFLP